jgi:hypothetical protein
LVREDDGRLVVHCSNCVVQLDLGPVGKARGRNRMPSGWVNAGSDRHYCPLCAQQVNIAVAFAAAQPAGIPQPLL